MKNVILLCCLCSIFACTESTTTENKSADTTEQKETKPTTFGEPTDAEGAISFEDLVKQMETQDTVTAKVIGEVESVCQVKGCWMNIASETNDAEMFVKFKDYGFFMPLDLTGKVVMDGYAYREITSVDDLRHYAEDEGLPADSIALITEPKEELKFLASGVMVMK